MGLDDGHFDRIEVYEGSYNTSCETRESGGVSDLNFGLELLGGGIAVKSARQGCRNS